MVLSLLERFVSETARLFVEISPYLLMGFFFAGLLHIFLGDRFIKKHFAAGGWGASIKAALFGVPLPVCSCGVIPIAESIRRDGASKSATMSFLVSTPTSGVDSILATYALMGPVFAIFRPIASFVSGILVGIVTHFQERKENHEDAPVQVETTGGGETKKSFKEMFEYGFRVVPSEISKYLIIGVIVGGAITAFVPGDFGSRYLQGPFLSYLVILLISIPLYICATGSIPIAASLMLKGVLPGAALALLIAGPATNTVTISFLVKRMGMKITAIYVATIVVVSVGTGLLFDWIWQSMGLSIGAISAGHGGHLMHIVEYVSAVLLVLVFLYSRYDFSKIFTKLGLKKEDTMSKNRITVTVPDMTCQHCKMKITQALDGMPEVESVSVDLDARHIFVETDSERQLIIDRIKQEGYHPE